MSSTDFSNKNMNTMLAVISTKLDNLMEKFEKLEYQLEDKVNYATLQTHVETYKKNLETLDEKLSEERKHRELIKEDIAYSKGQAKLAGTIWGTASSLLVGVLTHFFTK